MYKYKNNQPTVWFHKDKAKSNQNCLYCGTYIGVGAAVESNREHLIARSFVPKGYYSPTDFNFIVRQILTLYFAAVLVVIIKSLISSVMSPLLLFLIVILES